MMASLMLLLLVVLMLMGGVGVAGGKMKMRKDICKNK